MPNSKNSVFALIIILLTSCALFGQTDMERQLDYANNLFEKEMFFDAITEYKRLNYFDEKGLFTFHSNFRIGISYKKGAFIDNAILYLEKAAYCSSNPDQYYQAKLEVVKLNILRKTPEQALNLLDRLEAKEEFSYKSDELNYWRGWAYIFADDWRSAAKIFAKTREGKELEEICWKVATDKYSVTFAKVISYILPGSGLLYTGEVIPAFISLGWNVLFGYLSFEAFVEDRVFDGVVVAELLWLRFYRGNIQSAEKSAMEKNMAISNKALHELQNNYRGSKP